ncbi:MAG: NADP-dependent oxidoreductase, partial [Halioglobus sp.]
MKNQQIQLAARPVGEIKLTDFTLADTELPEVGEGQVLVQIHHLAVEPAMKGWIEARVDYVKPVEIGDVMRGSGSGIVVESKNEDFPVGSIVSGSFGWQRYTVTDGRAEAMRKIPDGISQTAALNVMGITGLTAYFGMGEIGKPQAGETVLISGAAGATGSIAGQLARIAGA